jgi:MscS family membrane protein
VRLTYPHYLAFLACFLLALPMQAQPLASRVQHAREKHAAENSDKNQPSDVLGRNTPNGTVVGFLGAARQGRYKEAAEYLEMPSTASSKHREEIARQLYVLMDSAFVERVGIISGQLEGSHQMGVPKDRQRIGAFRINGSDTNVDLVHVPASPSGEIWLFSSEVVGEVPNLFAQIEGGNTESAPARLPGVTNLLSSSPRRFIALLLLVVISLAAAWLLVYFLRALTGILPRWRKHPFIKDISKSLTAPMTLVLGVIIHQLGVYFLGIPVLTRLHYQRITSVLLVVGIAWLVLRLVRVFSDQARYRSLSSPEHRRGSLILLGQRIANVIIIIVAGLLSLSILGFNITGAIAGLGIGSIALAFAAQKTLENLLGGVAILSDEVIRIGETCRIGDREGTVEDISLRSTRFRTLECTELSVPNGQLASMTLENLSRRKKFLFRTKIGLRPDTSPEELRLLLAKVVSLLRENPKVDSNPFRVRLVGFAEASIDIEIHCHILTNNLDQFMTIREHLLLQIMEAITTAGTALAVSSRVLSIGEPVKRDMLREVQIRRSTG